MMEGPVVRSEGPVVVSALFYMFCLFPPRLLWTVNPTFPHSAKIFQKTKCNLCNSPLELPSVHFLCSHSFHQHCFESYAESEAECPTCTPENRKVMDMLRAQDQKRDLHDHFNRQVTQYMALE